MSTNKYDIKDLLDVVLNNKEIEVEAPITDDFILFVKEYDLQIGEELVKVDFLYDLYKQKYGSLIKKEFKKTIKKHFATQGNFVKININSIALSERAKKLIVTEKKKNPIHSKRYEKHFKLFLEVKNITQGQFWCSIDKLYKDYSKFRKERRLPLKINQDDFLDFFKHFNFEVKEEFVRVNNYEKDKKDNDQIP